MVNRKAWIRIVEAFVAILLITGILLLVVTERFVEKKDISLQIYAEEISILRKIELNKTLRTEIVEIISPPVSWDSFPPEVESIITDNTPTYLDCTAKICEISDACIIDELSSEVEKDIYVKSVAIFADLANYNPRQLKLFCWFK